MSLARFSATMQEGTGADWIANLRVALDGINAAIYGIQYANIGPLMGPMPRVDPSKEFISALRDLSIAFLRANCVPHRRAYTTRKDFRAAMLEFMRTIDQSDPPVVWNLSAGDYFPIADMVSAGLNLYPYVAKQGAGPLAVEFHKRLGSDFLSRNTDARERVRELLLAAGIDARDARNLLDGAELQKKRRAAKRPAR